jgi:tetratricopeptide (TPR) repeat protein
MAKAKRAAVKKPATKQRKWPQAADLGPWLECYLDVCEELPQVGQGAIEACTPLKQLAECGDSSGALARVERMLKRMGPKEVKAAACLAVVGADVCLALPDVARAEKYEQQAERLLAKANPADQKQIQLRLKHLRQTNGLLDAAGQEPTGDDEALLKVGRQRRAFRAALVAGDTKVASRALHKITRLIPEIEAFWLQPSLTLGAITGFRRLGDEAGLAKYVAWLDSSRHSNNLETGSLWSMGLTDLANQRAEKLVLARLKKLKRDDDVNIHFPVDEICQELWFFLQTGQPETAGKLLRRVLREMPEWPGLRGGFASAGVLTQLAEVLAEFDGPEAALQLLALAMQAGKAEANRGFRKGALKAAKQQIVAPGLGAAIAKAGEIKNATERRKALVPLLTRQAAWPELGAVLNDVADPESLRDLLHTVLFRLSGGGRIM